MKKDWEIKKLGEVCEVIAGQSPEGKFYNQDKKGTPFYQGKKDFGLKYLDEPTVWTTVETKIALENDILMSVRAPVGDINICTNRVCIGRGLAAIRASETINNDFLFYFLLSIKAKITGKEGAVFASINRQEIAALQIPVPPLEEQKRIVKILDEKFAQLETIKTNAQTNLQNAKDLFQSQLTKAFSNTTWEKKRLGNVCKIIGGGTPSKKNKNFYEGEIPWASVRDMSQDILTSTEFCITEEAVKSSSTNIIPAGNIIIATRVGLGKVCILNQNTAINQDLKGIIPINENKLDKTYLFWYFKSISDFIISNGVGATVHGVKLDFVQSLEIPLPPLPEQKRIVKELDTLSEKVRQLQEIYTKQIANCDELKQAYLQKAFEGEL